MSQGVGSQAPALQSLLCSPQSTQPELREDGLKTRQSSERPPSWASLEDSFPGSGGGRFVKWFAHPSAQSTSQERLKASLDESAGRPGPHWSALRMELQQSPETSWLGLSTEACPRDLLPAVSSSRQKG